jgi:hypothetical protein
MISRRRSGRVFVLPHEPTLYWCATKAIRGTTLPPPGFSVRWAFARRAILRLYDDRITCGNWTIAKADVTDATAFVTQGKLARTAVLQLTTADQVYQFGCNPWADPVVHLGLSVARVPMTLRYSRVSIAVRVAFVVLLVIWLVT